VFFNYLWAVLSTVVTIAAFVYAGVISGPLLNLVTAIQLRSHSPVFNHDSYKFLLNRELKKLTPAYVAMPTMCIIAFILKSVMQMEHYLILILASTIVIAAIGMLALATLTMYYFSARSLLQTDEE
jgi:hypothetical protein